MISTGIFGKSLYLLKACSDRLYAEPVSIKILETKRAVKLFCGIIIFYHLEISVTCTSFFTFIEKTGADLTGISSAAVIFTYMDCIDTDIVTVQNSKPSGNDLAVFCDGKRRPSL